MMRITRLGVFVGVIICVCAALADDWPQFRGPTGQGHSAASDLPTRWSENENVRWKTPISGLGWSSPIVVGEQIWLTTAVDHEQSLRAVCIDRRTGRVTRNVEVFRKRDLGRIASKNSHASPTPVADGRHVFVHFGAHGTACLTNDGQVVWRHELEYDHRHGPGGSPMLWKDLLIVSCDGPEEQFTVALDKATGDVRWKVEHPGEQAYCTPLVVRVKGVDQLITSGGENLIAYAPADGREIWRYRHNGHSVVPRPVVGNGLIYFCTGYWTPSLVALRPDGEGDMADHVAFSVTRGVPHNPSPLLVAGRLYMVSDLGILTCVDATDGREVWRQRLGGNFSASPSFADGKIYLLNEDGVMTIIAPGDSFQPLGSGNVEGTTLASPAFVDNAIYLRSDTHLYRIEQSAALSESRSLPDATSMSLRDTGTLRR